MLCHAHEEKIKKMARQHIRQQIRQLSVQLNDKRRSLWHTCRCTRGVCFLSQGKLRTRTEKRLALRVLWKRSGKDIFTRQTESATG